MKRLSNILIGFLFLFSNHYASAGLDFKDEHIAKCTGSKSCYACKNCKYCEHCNAGRGNCGVCSSSSPIGRVPVRMTIKQSPVSTTSSNSQCRGITKKGARCKRVVSGGGYCWQHS